MIRRAVWALAALLGLLGALAGFLVWLGPCEACRGRGVLVDGPDIVSVCRACEGAGW